MLSEKQLTKRKMLNPSFSALLARLARGQFLGQRSPRAPEHGKGTLDEVMGHCSLDSWGSQAWAARGLARMTNVTVGTVSAPGGLRLRGPTPHSTRQQAAKGRGPTSQKQEGGDHEQGGLGHQNLR